MFRKIGRVLVETIRRLTGAGLALLVFRLFMLIASITKGVAGAAAFTVAFATLGVVSMISGVIILCVVAAFGDIAVGFVVRFSFERWIVRRIKRHKSDEELRNIIDKLWLPAWAKRGLKTLFHCN